MVLRMGWRNLWRNPKRTLITLLALTLGVVAIEVLHSYRVAVFGQMTAMVTGSLLGHLQVHGTGYHDAPDIATLVHHPGQIEAVLAEKVPGATTVPRVLGFGLAGLGDASAGVMILGIEPTIERATTRMLTIEQGHDLDATPRHQVVLGSGLARQFEAAPGVEVVLVGAAADGSVANDRFTVVGIADAGTAQLNEGAVFLHLADAQDFFALAGGVHQLMVHLPPAAGDDEDVRQAVGALRATLDLTALEVLSWSEIMPEFRGLVTSKEQGMKMIDFVVTLLVALGVLNAMIMATLERTRELGVMASVGTSPTRIVALVLTEALMQGALAFAAGTILATALIYGVGSIDLGSFGQNAGDVAGVRMPVVVELRLAGASLQSAVTVCLACGLLGGLWPAVRAARLRPATAVRHV